VAVLAFLDHREAPRVGLSPGVAFMLRRVSNVAGVAYLSSLRGRMSFSLGLYELFAYAVPGSLTLALLVYVGTRVDCVDLTKLHDVPSAISLVGAAIVSYALGHFVYAFGELVSRFLPFRKPSQAIRESFVSKVPAAADRTYVGADRHLLLAVVELNNREVATEIIRLRALGIMSRSLSVPLALASVTALVEAFVSSHTAFAACCAFLFMLGTVVFLWQGQVLQRWAYAKTLEICFWLPDIDERVTATRQDEAPSGVPSTRPTAEQATPSIT
jgi:hypothetical protein